MRDERIAIEKKRVKLRALAERDLAANDYGRDGKLFEKAVIPCVKFDKTDTHSKTAAADDEQAKERMIAG